MFISPAYAQSAGGGSGLEAMLPLVLIFIVFYFLLIGVLTITSSGSTLIFLTFLSFPNPPREGCMCKPPGRVAAGRAMTSTPGAQPTSSRDFRTSQIAELQAKREELLEELLDEIWSAAGQGMLAGCAR